MVIFSFRIYFWLFFLNIIFVPFILLDQFKENILKCREIPDYVGIDKVDEALALADFGQAERELVRSLLTDFVDYGEEGEETIDEWNESESEICLETQGK